MTATTNIRMVVGLKILPLSSKAGRRSLTVCQRRSADSRDLVFVHHGLGSYVVPTETERETGFEQEEFTQCKILNTVLGAAVHGRPTMQMNLFQFLLFCVLLCPFVYCLHVCMQCCMYINKNTPQQQQICYNIQAVKDAENYHMTRKRAREPLFLRITQAI